MIDLSWVWWLVGALGIGGAIAAVVLAPAIAIPALQAIAGFVIRCKPCLVALAIIGAFIAGDVTGERKAAARCNASQLAAKLAAQQADLDNAQRAAADEKRRADTIETETTAERKRTAAYVQSLETRPVCALTDDDIGMRPVSRSGRKKPAAGAK